MSLKSYLLIKNISESLFEKLKSGEEILLELENYANIISETISDDFFEITKEKLIIDNVFFYYDEIDYRQSATAYIVKTYFRSNPNLIVNFECLIDFDRIFLSVKTENLTDSNLNLIISNIKKKYNSEGLVELKDLV